MPYLCFFSFSTLYLFLEFLVDLILMRDCVEIVSAKLLALTKTIAKILKSKNFKIQYEYDKDFLREYINKLFSWKYKSYCISSRKARVFALVEYIQQNKHVLFT